MARSDIENTLLQLDCSLVLPRSRGISTNLLTSLHPGANQSSYQTSQVQLVDWKNVSNGRNRRKTGAAMVVDRIMEMEKRFVMGQQTTAARRSPIFP